MSNTDSLINRLLDGQQKQNEINAEVAKNLGEVAHELKIANKTSEENKADLKEVKSELAKAKPTIERSAKWHKRFDGWLTKAVGTLLVIVVLFIANATYEKVTTEQTKEATKNG